MKTYRFIYFVAASSLLFAACSREAVAPEENLTPGENTGGTYPVYFGAEATLNDAASGDDITAGTKVSLTPDADDYSFEASWDYLDKGSIQYSYNDGTNSLTDQYKDATWNGSSFTVYFDSGHSKIEANWKYTLVYPYIDINLSKKAGKDRIQIGNAYNSNYDLMIGNASVTSALPGEDDDKNPIVFNMLRETGIAYFHFTSNLDETLVSATLTVDGGTIASEAVSIKSQTNYSQGFEYSGEQYNSINMTFTDAPSARDFKLWFNVLPTKYNSSTLVIETTAHKLTLTKKAGKDPYSYDTQKLYKVTRTVADAKWVALPKYAITCTTVEGGTLSADYTEAVRGTLVTLTAIADDGYEFKNDWNVTDSQGNKITVSDGKFTMPESDITVTASFAATTSSDINLSSNGIANCYIVPPTADLKYKFQTSNLGGSVDNVTSCEVLWESFGTSTAPKVGDLVKNVSYSDGYISFTTTGKAGNALIAAKNGEDILWSWHIWIPETTITDVTVGSATFYDRNLGALKNLPGDPLSNGLTYQWGRKDPFMGSYSLTTSTIASSTTSFTTATGPVDISISTKNPTVFYTGSNNRADNSDGWSDDKKTIYDPCPSGYRVPTYNTFNSNFYSTNNIYTAGDNGIYVKGTNIWFGMCGDISKSGSFEYVNSRGNYWTSTLQSGTSYYYMRVRSGYGFTSFQITATQGNSVRCQKM